MKAWKRGLASLLTAAMLFSMLPTSVFATEAAPPDGMPSAQESVLEAVAGPAENSVEEPDSEITAENPDVTEADSEITAENPDV
ncbi:MAG: hypothetical protein IJK52_10700, partial [Oscillospiraceae bacterium]|nr:hypothetical protein [Oscillospiraceae bacterium]